MLGRWVFKVLVGAVLAEKRVSKGLRYFLPAVFLIVFVFCGLECGYTRTSPLYTHFTYVFQHAHWFHLATNVFSLFCIWRVLERFIPLYRILNAFVIAVGVSFLAVSDLPTVGSSAVVYAMVGAMAGLAVNGRIRFRDAKRAFFFFASVGVCLLVGAWRQGGNVGLHLWALGGGAAIELLISRREGGGISKLVN
jgi:membrane associated rhomboid family serine protease